MYEPVKISYGGGWLLLCGCVSFLAIVVETASQDALKYQQGSQCFNVRGVPTLQLQCSGNDLIRVTQSFYGVVTGSSNASSSVQSCSYVAKENHCIQLSDMSQNCNGRTRCSVFVSNPFLVTCLAYATYMQVNYTCVPRSQIYDVCEQVILSSTHGYIRSPNYPDSPYGSNRDCKCTLQTKDRYVVLNILDLNINGTAKKPATCTNDYLAITGQAKKCGQLSADSVPQRIEYGGGKLTVQFKSDNTVEGRGFWLDYAGSSGGKVSISCSQTTQSAAANNVVLANTAAAGLKVAVTTAATTAKSTSANHVTNAVKTQVTAAGSQQDRYLIETAGMVSYNVDDVQIATGVVVGILILIAIVIIIFLVFKR